MTASTITVVGLHHYLIVSGVLFAIGIYGLLTRKNLLLVLLSIELVLNAANLSFVAFSAYRGELSGQIMVFFTMIVAAAEAVVGLAIAVLFFRSKKTTSVDTLSVLKW